MLNIFQMLFELVKPKVFSIDPITLSLIGSATGSLMQGAGSLMGGSEEAPTIRDQYPSQTMDYTNYAMAMQRATRNKILNMVNKRSYEGYEGGKNLATIGQSAAIEATKQKPPDYFAQSAQFAEGLKDDGVSEVLGSLSGYAPQTDIYKADADKTEWDKIAEANGITVTKYSDFQSEAELKEALFQKNKSEIEVSDTEIFLAEQIGYAVLGRFFPQAANWWKTMCGVGQCDDMYAGLIRGIKASSRTFKQLNQTNTNNNQTTKT